LLDTAGVGTNPGTEKEPPAVSKCWKICLARWANSHDPGAGLAGSIARPAGGDYDF
jgi:hypothetical protein